MMRKLQLSCLSPKVRTVQDILLSFRKERRILREKKAILHGAHLDDMATSVRPTWVPRQRNNTRTERTRAKNISKKNLHGIQ